MQFRRSLAPALIAASGLAFYSPLLLAQTPASTEEALRQRVEDLEQKLRRLEERLEQQAQQQPAPQAPAAPSAAAAPEPTAREQVLQQRVEELDQQVKILGRKQELEREAAAVKAKESPTVMAGREGVGLKSADGAFQLRFRAHLHADSRWYADNPSPTDQRDGFLLRRVRPILEGTFYEKFGFRLMPDFAGGTTQILDAYVDANPYPQFRIRAGKFKGPVGLERLQSPADILFIERGFPTQLVPNRDIGLQLSGDLVGGTLGYQVGFFDDTVDGGSIDSDSNNGKDFAGRLFAQPFKNSDIGPLQGLGVGFAYTSGNQIGTATTSNLPRFLTPGQNTFFSYASGAFADGSRNRYAPQLYYSWGPLGMLGEYVVSRQEITRGTNHREISNSAWELTASYVLSGEDASMSKDPVFRKYYHNNLTFRMLYAWHENFVLPLSHDEVVHGKGSLLRRMPGDDWQKFANLRLLFGYMYGQPGKKLLFMGGEFGQWDEWYHETSLDWHLLQFDSHAGVQRWVEDLNRLHRQEPALHEQDFTPAGFEWIDCNDIDSSVVSFVRKAKNPENMLLMAANFTPVVRLNYRVGVPMLAQQHKSTLFMVLLAGLQVLLYRYTGQTSNNICTVIANRTVNDLEKLIGLFLNTLVLHADLQRNPTCIEVLQQARRTTLAAYDHQAVPFQKVLEALQTQPGFEHAALFQVLLTLQNVPNPEVRLSNLECQRFMREMDFQADMDLTLSLVEAPEGLIGYLQYQADLFEAATIHVSGTSTDG